MFVKHYGETLDVYFFKMEYGIFAPCMAKQYGSETPWCMEIYNAQMAMRPVKH